MAGGFKGKATMDSRQQLHTRSALFSEQSLPNLSVNTPAKPMAASAVTLKSCGFFIGLKKLGAA